MSRFRSWVTSVPGTQYVPLFDVDDGLKVRTAERMTGRRLLRRSREMEEALIRVVDTGLADPTWRGFLYVMAWGEKHSLKPLYVGMASRFGRTAEKVSVNLVNLGSDKGKFGRWGDGNAYHIGDLSQALFGWSAYKHAEQKYVRWAEKLFVDRPTARLREPTYLLIVPWHEGQLGTTGQPATLKQIESQLIELAIEEFEDVVLNVQGESWWAPAVAPERPSPDDAPAPQHELVVESADLVRVATRVANEPIIGLDVETTLYTQDLCLLQLATRDRVYVIDALALSDLAPLRHPLGSKGPVKVVHNAAFERRILTEKASIALGNVFDTLKISRQVGPKKASHRLEAVCRRHLGRVLDKSQQISDWSQRPLSRQQIAYAVRDAAVLLELQVHFEHQTKQRKLF